VSRAYQWVAYFSTTLLFWNIIIQPQYIKLIKTTGIWWTRYIYSFLTSSRIILSFSTSIIAPRARFLLVLTNPSRIFIVSNLFIYLLLGQNIICILYSKCTPLTNMILFGPPTFGKYFICLTQNIDLGGYKNQLVN
jgi:hypothetical protein